MFQSQTHFLKIYVLQSAENPSSLQAEKISEVFHNFYYAAGGMLLLVGFLIVYICIKFAAKKGDTSTPVQTSGSKKLEVFMIGIPTLLLTWFFYQTITTMRFVAPPVESGRQPDVVITGHQWWWEVQYPAYGVVTANEVHLPVGTSLVMEMRSADVIHDWWVPELGNKVDLVPNSRNYLSLYINEPGRYLGACSEFCGAQHAWMRISVIAQNDKDFKDWISQHQEQASKPKDRLSVTGARLFQTKTCGTCHRIQGTNATGNEGPDLTHLASRPGILTGLMENNYENLMKWIDHPQKIKPGVHMPDFKFEKDTLAALVSYLQQLK